jgi:PEP-CTERM motif
MKTLRFLCIGFAAVVGMAMGATRASGTISYTCAANIDATVAGTCAMLNGTIAGLYNSTFSNANASIYVTYGATGLASSLQYYTNVTYTAYVNALTLNEGDANDVTAVASLGGSVTNPVVAGDGVALTSALATTLGLTTVAGSFGINPLSFATCTLGSVGCYNGYITLTNAANTWYYRSGLQPAGTYDINTAVEHETDEVLGTSSCITGNSNNAATIATSVGCRNGLNGNPSTGVSPADLFRYSSSGTRSYLSTANGTPAYFSINNGVTNVANYNNQPNGADYGDWNSAALRVQNAVGTPDTNGTDITNDGGSEIAVLDAVGYNLTTVTTVTPEPSSMALFGTGLLGIGLLMRKR